MRARGRPGFVRAGAASPDHAHVKAVAFAIRMPAMHAGAAARTREMNMRRMIFSLAAVAIGLGCSHAIAQPAPQHTNCFFVNQFESWRAPDDKTIFIRVGMSRYYRLDLSGTCPRLQSPDVHLVMNVRGPDTICTALDWDLKVADNMPGNISSPCIVRTMTELSPADAAAIPKKFKP
jgi:hypothetical protein